MRRCAVIISILILFTLINCGGQTSSKNGSTDTPAINKNTVTPTPKPTRNSSEIKTIKPGEKASNLPKKELPADKRVAIPKDWITFYDEAKGYEFSVPKGAATEFESSNGLDYFEAKLPAPSKVEVYVFSYNDKTLSKEDLIEDAVAFLKNGGEKNIMMTKPQEMNEQYALVDISSTDDKGVKLKYKLLVATDVTDNYLLYVSVPEGEYKANEELIDKIWSSFGMYNAD